MHMLNHSFSGFLKSRFLIFTAAFSLVSSPLSFAAAQQPNWGAPPSSAPSNPSAQPPTLSPEQTAYLADLFKDTWNYLADQVEPATGLPYDSDTQQPATSISNVGLYFAAVSVAFRTGLVSREEAISRLSLAMTSLEKIERWEGFPRVWVTARGLKPISGTEIFSYSKHVSNLIGGLILMQTTFPDELGSRVGDYMRGMKFQDMYDPNTGWLKGGYDSIHDKYAVSQPFGPWFYKFFASEARLISFFATAKGFAPPSHWQSLSRPIQKEGNNWFFVSSYEDGGAYMPYMASLYIDERPTLMGTSQKNLSAHQMEHARQIGSPVWGWSAGLDTRGEYIPYGQLKDSTIAPYASIFALPYFPKEVFENLKNLEALGGRPVHDMTQKYNAPALFYDNNGTPTPWAIAGNFDVFFIDQNGELEKLSTYLIKKYENQPIQDYDPAAILNSLKNSGHPIPSGSKPEDIIVNVLWGTFVHPSIKNRLLDPAMLPDLLNLAAQSNLYSPAKVILKNGQEISIAIQDGRLPGLDDNAPLKPWAVSGNGDVFFIDKNGKLEKLSAFTNPPTNSPVTIQNPNSLIELSKAAGYPDGTIPTLTLGSTLKSELTQSLPDPSAFADLVSLGLQSGALIPGTAVFPDGKKLQVLFDLQSEAPIPFALLTEKEIFFMNSSGSAQTFSPLISPKVQVSVIGNYESSPLDTLVPAIAVPLKYGENAQSNILYIKKETETLPDFETALPQAINRAQVIGSAEQKNLLSPNLIHLLSSATIPVIFLMPSSEPPADIASPAKPWAVMDKKDVLFINRSGAVEKLSTYVDPASSAKPVSVENLALLKKISETAGYSQQNNAGLTTSLTPIPDLKMGTVLNPELVNALPNPGLFADLIALGYQSGLLKPGAAVFPDNRKFPVFYKMTSGNPEPVAIAVNSEIILFTADAQPRNFRSLIDIDRTPGNIENYDLNPLQILVSRLQNPIQQGKPLDESILKITDQTPLSPFFANLFKDPIAQGSVLGYASQLGLIDSPTIRFTSGEDVPIIFITSNPSSSSPILTGADTGSIKPWALAASRDVFIITQADTVAKFSDYAKNPILPSPLLNDYPAELQKILNIAGYQPSEKISETDFVKGITAGTEIQTGLSGLLPTPASLSQLLALATQNGSYKSAEILLADGRKVPAFFNNTILDSKPVAIAAGKEVYFYNEKGAIDRLSDFVKQHECAEISGLQNSELNKLTGAAGLAGKTAHHACASEKGLSPFLAKFSDENIAAGILSLGVKAGLYTPGTLSLSNGQTYPAAFFDSSKPASAAAAFAGKSLSFESKRDSSQKMESLVDKSSLGKPLTHYAPENLALLTKAIGYDLASAGDTKSVVEQVTQGARLKPDFFSVLQKQETAPEVLALAGKSGVLPTAKINLKQERKEKYGFRDAVDWQNKKVSAHFLTPSQGMAFLALANFLHDGVVWKAFSEDPKIKQGVASILKSAPEEASIVEKQGADCLCSLPSTVFSKKP